MRALVIFSDAGCGLWHRVLRRGFRHCAVLIDDGCYWVGFDTADGRTRVRVLAESSADLAAHYRGLCGTVLEVTLARRPLSNGFGPHSCVTAIKRLLSIRAWWVQTPWQLYRYLEDR